MRTPTVLCGLLISILTNNCSGLFTQDKDRYPPVDSTFYRNILDRDGNIPRNDGGDMSMRMYLWSTSDKMKANLEDFGKNLKSELADYRNRFFRKSWSRTDDTDTVGSNTNKIPQSYHPALRDFDKSRDTAQYPQISRNENLIQSFISEMKILLNKKQDNFGKTFPQSNQLWYGGGQDRVTYGIDDFMKDFSNILSS